MKTYELHPYACVFPALSRGGDVFAKLVADIAQNGLREPITLLDGAILDGRNRASACHEAGIEPRFVEWQPAHPGDSPLAFVISKNLARRHLNDSQRAVIAARLANHPGSNAPGVPKRRGGKSDGHVTKGDAAKMLNVSPSRVRMAREVINKAPADVVAKVDAGDMTVGEAWRTEIEERRPSKINGAAPPPAEPRARVRIHDSGPPARLEADKLLLVELRGLIDGISSRRQEVALISRPARLELVMDFARALGVAPAAATVDRQTVGGVAGYA